jgi:DNA end-binding protein Ku
MARPIWSGAVNFGLVTVPVNLYSATGDHSVHFRQFERGTSDRIRYRRVNERTGEEVDFQNIVKGYELEDGDYVIVEPDELDSIAPGRSRTIDISAFVDLDQIDPIYFGKSYWLGPAKEEFDRAYGLLMHALSTTGKAGIAKFVMRGKEHVAAVRAGEHTLILDTMLFAEDVRDPKTELRRLPKAPEAKKKELDMAVDLIESMSEDWDPDEFRDTYTERVLRLIEDKREGRAVVTESEPPDATKVVDLFDALSRSVESTRGKRSRGKQQPPADEDVSTLTKSELEERARKLDIKGRSKMTRAELAEAVSSASASASASASGGRQRKRTAS